MPLFGPIGYTDKGRDLFVNSDGGYSSEITVTVPYGGKWIVLPSIWGGEVKNEDWISEYLDKNGLVDVETGQAIPVFDSMEEANEYAKNRSQNIIKKYTAPGPWKFDY